MPLLRRLLLTAPAGLLGAVALRTPRFALAAEGEPDAAAAPAEPAGDPALALINAFRAAAGVPPAELNPALLRSAEGHVQYYDLNRGDPSLNGMGLHQQQPDRPGYTGATMGERAKNAGYGQGSVTENAGFGTIESAIRWAIGTVNHRLPLLHPTATDMGYAVSGGPAGNGFNVIAVGLRRPAVSLPTIGRRGAPAPAAPTASAVSLPSVYPPDGATSVPRTWDGGEAPDPAPGVPRPLGYPITVAFGAQQRVEWKTLALFGPDGQPLPVSTPTTEWMRAAAIIPHRPLQVGQTYTGCVEAVADGQPVTKTWQFTAA